MPTTMSLWRLDEDGSASPILEERLAAEKQIESAVESAPELLGVDGLIVGRQVPTPAGPLDLLAMDAGAHLVVIENKRDRTPRDVLAQAIDYAAYIDTLTLADVAEVYQAYRERFDDDSADLLEDFEEHFGETLDDLADTPKMVIVASRLDDSTERMINFLAERFSLPVNAALFQPFAGGLIGRTWLRAEEHRPPVRAQNTKSRDESKQFWDAWLPIGREMLPDIHLPANGPRSVLIKRKILAGVPAALVVWVSASEAYAEVQFDDDAPSMNEALLSALEETRSLIQQKFGASLEWRRPESTGLMTKRTKVVTPKVDIGDRTDPSRAGLEELATSARRLVDAVEPHLRDAYEKATASLDDESAGSLS